MSISFSDLDGDWIDDLIKSANDAEAGDGDSEAKGGITRSAVQAALEEALERAKKAKHDKASEG
eukprot:6516643-Pyramimonas_sp.AAC.1